MTPTEPLTPDKSASPALPRLKAFGKTAYVYNFDPLGVSVGRVVRNRSDSVRDIRNEAARDDFLNTLLIEYRNHFAFLIAAARLCSFDVNRVSVRLGPANRKFDHNQFEAQIRGAFERAIRRKTLQSLINAAGQRTPLWLVQEPFVAVGVDGLSAKGKQLHCEQDLQLPDFPVEESEDELGSLIARLLVVAIHVKWEAVGPNRLAATSPKDFLALIHRVDTGDSPEERLNAAKRLAETAVPCDEVPILTELLDGKDERVQVHLVKAIGNALLDGNQVGIERAREYAGSHLLRALGGALVGDAIEEAVKVVALVSKQPGPLHDTLRMLVDQLGRAGMATHAIPVSEDFTSLVLASSRSRTARKRLQEKMSERGVMDPADHELLNKIREFRDQGRGADPPRKKQLLEDLQQVLSQLEGLTFGTLNANRAVAVLINETIELFGQRLVCPRGDCAMAARLSVSSASEHGLFALDHGRRVPGRYHLASSYLPALRLLNDPQ